MTIPLLDSGKGLFEILGKFAHALNTLNTARGTTVLTEALDAYETYKLKTDATLDFDRAVASFPRSEAQWRVSGDTLASAIARACQGLLIEFVLADDPTVRRDLRECLEYLIDEMVTQTHYVSGNTVSVTEASGGVGFGFRWLDFVFGVRGQNGRQLDNMIAETLTAEVLSSAGQSCTLRVTGERAARNKRAEDFPAGSGVNRVITALTVDDSLLTNAGFEGEYYTIGSYMVPYGWQVSGVTGDNLQVLTANTLEITVSGTPTVGDYWLSFTGDRNLITPALAFDTTGPELQAALRELPGFELVEVSTTGTSPDYVHTITFTGCNDVALSSAPDTFDQGGVAETDSSGSGTTRINGQTLQFRAGTDLPSLQQTVQLTEGQTYVLAVRMTRGGAVAPAGIAKLSLVDASGSIITDNNSSQITVSKDVEDVSDSQITAMGVIFTLPDGYGDQIVRVKFELTEAIDSSEELYLDDVILAPVSELYPGGPYMAAIGGTMPPQVGATWTFTVANDYASDWQLAFDRLFDMAGKRLVLPTSGSTLINDNLIA